jgi:hypothetical protein
VYLFKTAKSKYAKLHPPAPWKTTECRLGFLTPQLGDIGRERHFLKNPCCLWLVSAALTLPEKRTM